MSMMGRLFGAAVVASAVLGTAMNIPTASAAPAAHADPAAPAAAPVADSDEEVPASTDYDPEVAGIFSDEANELGVPQRLPAAIVLLSDGANTAGNEDPITVAERARRFRIPVYTVALGTQEGYIEHTRKDGSDNPKGRARNRRVTITFPR